MTIISKVKLKNSGLKHESAHQIYKRRFALFVKSTDQKLRQIENIQKIVSPMAQKGDFLDVGSGSGEITTAISAFFDRTTVVEPNPVHVEQLARRFPKFKIHKNKFDCVDLVGSQFDFILCSHVLYYIPEKNWMPMIERMAFHLRPQGKLVVVLQSPEGTLPDLLRKLGGKTGEAIRLWLALVRKFGSDRVRAHYGISRIETRLLQEMAEIAIFLFHEKRFERKKSAISRYLDKNCKTGDGYVVEQDYITFEINKGI